MWVLYEIVPNGSKWGGSQVRIESVPPRLGVWARPVDGATAVPARANPPRASRSRRLTSMGPPGSSSGRAGGDGGQRLVEDPERGVHVGVAVGERDVDLVDGLHDAALETFLVEERDAAAIGGEGCPVVHDGAVGEDDVEDRRLATHLRGHAVLAGERGEAVAQAGARR